MNIPKNPPDSYKRKKRKKAEREVDALRDAMQESVAAEPLKKKPAATAPSQPKSETPPQPETAKPETTAQTQDAPISFDLIEWSQILYRVSEESQRLIRDYVERMHNKPVDTVPFTPHPMLESMTQLTTRILEDPEAYTKAQLALWQHYVDITRSTLLRMQGQAADPVAEASPQDKRFKDKDWQSNWMFDYLKQTYLSTVDETRRLVRQESAHIKGKWAKKIDFYTRLFLDASSPSNFWLTNPEVLRATRASQGDNLIKGLENLLQDLERGNGTLRIRMSDYHAFELGKNIAATPGKVVYQNDLMQLIQYAPSTPTAHRVPLLIIPPWINKYYILDLRDKNSFIKYLVAQGHTVFCISWINPTAQHAAVTFEDYMDKGALSALRQVKQIIGEDDINVLGYCIGGTLLASTLAHLAALPQKPKDLPAIASATYLVTMIDFSSPGDLGVFIDEEQISLLEDRMNRQGYMDAGSMMLTFNLLRANDLIWPFVINNYLLGREPFAFDILYWNTDSTNLPAAMQSYYLRNMYLNNKLIEPDALVMKNIPLDLTKITIPSFVLGTRDDHIAPWQSTYVATQTYAGDVTFTLAGSGHIAGVINHPDTEKYSYWTNPENPANPEEWLANAKEHKGSWWTGWLNWLAPYAGEKIPAREVKNGIENAPGSYVKVRAA